MPSKYTVLLDCDNCGSSTAFSFYKGSTINSQAAGLKCAYCECNRINTTSGATPLYYESTNSDH